MRREITIQRGECEVYVEGMDMPCPFCGTLVRAGKTHKCGSQTTLDAVATTGGKVTVEHRQPHKGAK